MLIDRAHLDALQSQALHTSIELIQRVRIVPLGGHEPDDLLRMRVGIGGDASSIAVQYRSGVLC